MFHGSFLLFFLQAFQKRDLLEFKRQVREMEEAIDSLHAAVGSFRALQAADRRVARMDTAKLQSHVEFCARTAVQVGAVGQWGEGLARAGRLGGLALHPGARRPPQGHHPARV